MAPCTLPYANLHEFNNSMKLTANQNSLLYGFLISELFIAQKMKFSIKDFFSKCGFSRFLRIWSHLLKKSLMENFIFCAVIGVFCNTISQIALDIRMYFVTFLTKVLLKSYRTLA